MKTLPAVLLLCALLVGCGGGSGSNSNPNPNPAQASVKAISNGATLATATSYWLTGQTPYGIIGLTITSDGAFQTTFYGSNGPPIVYSATCTGQYSFPSANNNLTVLLGGTCSGTSGEPLSFIESMTSISGSISSGSFSPQFASLSVNGGTVTNAQLAFTLCVGGEGELCQKP